MKNLVIVESPTKAKTISKFLGRNFVVKSSFGHVRDLPKSKLGVDVENNFEPHYIVSRDKSKVAKELKDAAKKCDGILFATDEDREGEAISWHLANILGIEPKDAKRIVFHEITKTAIMHALENPRPLDLKMVDAQQARRILDRLVGYELSPFLWRKVAKGLSAGRVQSVAVRLIVEREREIKAFNPEEYWSIEGAFTPDSKEIFTGKLYAIKDKKIDKLDIKTKAEIDKILADLEKTTYKVESVEEKKTKRLPSPPFTTSTLQQEANSHLGFSAKQTMRLAQQLYEGIALGTEGSVGLITYMRTDAVNLSEKFLAEAKEVIGTNFGKKYQLATPRFYNNKSKNAQEAHEAVRPTEAIRTPESIEQYLDRQQFRLYDLIWRRAMATQMAPAELNATTIDISSSNDYKFRANGQTIVFDGFLKLFPDRAKENLLPVIKTNETLTCTELKPEQHFTEPPARYSDATLVKAMENYGIGRPSTYAPTISTIEDRGYIERNEQKRFAPKDIAYIVNDLLVEHFFHVVDYQFTAEMENNLDEIAHGKKEWRPVISAFWKPFKENLDKKEIEIDKKVLTEEKSDEKCKKCNSDMIIKTGRFGKYLACTKYPECKTTKSLNAEEAKQQEAIEEANEKCEKCGEPMTLRRGRFGPFLGCSGYPKCKNIKNIEVKMNMKCPKCGQGDIVQRRSKRGKPFYSCNRYPDCEYALWEKPTGEFCPTCKQPLTYAPKGVIKCSSKECDFKKNTEESAPSESAPTEE
ncbi:MAG: DNA topoisomerase I [Candidatus Magasanikbacteria bacterium RIFOXYD2_FULL_39_9]|uniref:DNA topoisomerase 1 n=1 Tax=Candidatus Magasanikbacteria bacterium RIFOXYD1_FULL_40_23 TaxID=1798705 RepID=A0A1F6PAG3_9BACT|nr:MAG: DNA topoisomerase I [Candidatus Magasanikbacteria bacterium RIFOXYD2_FULL_39_9]OGH93108.1 MAG: DNA topoisomerase I [Candidatus Magasanikbacteria bacterium RIFOXYD1_FULL_40_23]